MLLNLIPIQGLDFPLQDSDKTLHTRKSTELVPTTLSTSIPVRTASQPLPSVMVTEPSSCQTCRIFHCTYLITIFILPNITVRTYSSAYIDIDCTIISGTLSRQ
ncbi:MAG: hypothetical protein R2784_01075 [Saprospiraceae bacterium]